MIHQIMTPRFSSSRVRARLRRWAWFAGGLGLASMPGCGPTRSEPERPPVPVVLVLPAQTNEATGAFVALARETFPEADVYPAVSRLARAARRHVLLVLQAEQLDPIQWPALAQSLEGGTPILFWGRDPLARLRETPPDLPMISPAYRRFDSSAVRLRRMDREQDVGFSMPVQSPFPRPLGRVADPNAVARWIPLAETEDATGLGRAWPASLWVEAGTGTQARSWGWVGIDVPAQQREVVVDLLRTAAQRLQDGHFLLSAGADRVALHGGTHLEVGVQVLRNEESVANLRVAAELKEVASLATRRVSAPAEERLTLNLGALPRIPDRHRDYVLRVSLWSADDEQQYDELVQELRILPTAEPLAVERIGVTGSGFTLGRRPLFLFGAPLVLRSAVGLAENEAGRHPLDPEVFDPAAVEQEIRRAQEAGLNLLSLSLEEERQIPQLRWLLEELRPRSMWIQLQVAGLDPLHLDLPRARHLLETARVARDPVLFALQAGAQTTLGPEEQRRPWDADWRAWLVEQYGLIAHAEQVVGQPLWRRDGEVTGPPDAELAGAGAAPAAVAVYRRFMDDWISRRLAQVRGVMQELKSPALLGAARGWGGPPESFPLDPASGAVHLDYVLLDAEGLATNDTARAAAAFSAVYARGLGLGKPVVWMNLGHDAGPQPTAATLRNQGDRVQELLGLALRSHSSGLLVKRLPGGWCPRAHTDEGYAQPDGNWRPAGEVLRRFTLRVRREASAPLSWSGTTLTRDADPRGLYGLLQERAADYQLTAANPLAEVRPLGFSLTSFEIDNTSVGGRPHQDPAPWSMLNGEWGGVRAGGRRLERGLGGLASVSVRAELELEVWNTGAARWVNANAKRAGAIWVQARHPTAREQWLPVPDTPPGQRAVIRWTPADVGRWDLRLWNWSEGGFGEPLAIDVQP